MNLSLAQLQPQLVYCIVELINQNITYNNRFTICIPLVANYMLIFTERNLPQPTKPHPPHSHTKLCMAKLRKVATLIHLTVKVGTSMLFYQLSIVSHALSKIAINNRLSCQICKSNTVRCLCWKLPPPVKCLTTVRKFLLSFNLRLIS